jgi:hypothetical protein
MQSRMERRKPPSKLRLRSVTQKLADKPRSVSPDGKYSNASIQNIAFFGGAEGRSAFERGPANLNRSGTRQRMKVVPQFVNKIKGVGDHAKYRPKNHAT